MALFTPTKSVSRQTITGDFSTKSGAMGESIWYGLSADIDLWDIGIYDKYFFETASARIITLPNTGSIPLTRAATGYTVTIKVLDTSAAGITVTDGTISTVINPGEYRKFVAKVTNDFEVLDPSAGTGGSQDLQTTYDVSADGEIVESNAKPLVFTNAAGDGANELFEVRNNSTTTFLKVENTSGGSDTGLVSMFPISNTGTQTDSVNVNSTLGAGNTNSVALNGTNITGTTNTLASGAVTVPSGSGLTVLGDNSTNLTLNNIVDNSLYKKFTGGEYTISGNVMPGSVNNSPNKTYKTFNYIGVTSPVNTPVPFISSNCTVLVEGRIIAVCKVASGVAVVGDKITTQFTFTSVGTSGPTLTLASGPLEYKSLISTGGAEDTSIGDITSITNVIFTSTEPLAEYNVQVYLDIVQLTD